jgi:hypothetical protein
MRLLALLPLTVLACADGNRTASGSGPGKTIAVDLGAYEGSHRFIAREGLRIGDTSDGVIFGRLSDVSASQNGDVYAVDAANHQIWMFDDGGRLLRRFARQGQGPGEFTGDFPPLLAIGDDTVYVIDKTLHAFSLNGDFLYSRGLRAESGNVSHPSLTIVSTVAGLMAAWSHRSGTRATDGEFEEDTMWVQARPRNSETFDGSRFPLAGLRKLAVRTSAGRVYVATALGAGPALAIAPTGHVFYSRGAEYAIDQFDHAGTLVARLTGDVAPVPIPRARSDSVRQATLERLKSQPFPSEDMRRRSIEARERTPPIRFRPILGRLVAGDSGVLLVERVDLAKTNAGEISNWDVLDATAGRLLGRLELPRSFTPRYLRNWRLYGTDYNVVPQVVRFDIVR